MGARFARWTGECARPHAGVFIPFWDFSEKSLAVITEVRGLAMLYRGWFLLFRRRTIPAALVDAPSGTSPPLSRFASG